MAHHPVSLAEFHLLGHEPSCLSAISINVPFGPVAEAVRLIEYSSCSSILPSFYREPRRWASLQCEAGDPHVGHFSTPFPVVTLKEVGCFWWCGARWQSFRQSRPQSGWAIPRSLCLRGSLTSGFSRASKTACSLCFVGIWKPLPSELFSLS